MAKIYVKLGKKASSFRDQASNITILPGQVVGLDVKQQNSKKIKAALSGGHLVYAEAPAKPESTKVVKTAQEVYEDFSAMVEAGEPEATILKAFTLDQFKQLADLAGLEVEKSDTKKTLYEALIAEVDEGDEE